MLNQFSKTWTLLKRIKKCLKNSRKMRSSTTCKIRCRNLEMQVQTTYESTPSSWVSSGSVSKWRLPVEWKWNLSKSGHPVHSIGDCVPLAHPKWKTEPEAVRKKYEAKAKAHKEVRLECEFLFSAHKSKPLKPPISRSFYLWLIQKMRCTESEGRLDNTGKPISEYRNPDEVLDQNRKMVRVDISRSLPHGENAPGRSASFIIC